MFNPNPKPEKISRKSKYNSVKQTYKNFSYDSKMEANYAAQLDWLVKANKVTKWERQCKLELNVNGVHIANYFVDFKVFYPDGRVEYHEVKGAETQLWRMKWRLSKALYPNENFVLIKKVDKW